MKYNKYQISCIIQIYTHYKISFLFLLKWWQGVPHETARSPILFNIIQDIPLIPELRLRSILTTSPESHLSQLSSIVRLTSIIFQYLPWYNRWRFPFNGRNILSAKISITGHPVEWKTAVKQHHVQQKVNVETLNRACTKKTVIAFIKLKPFVNNSKIRQLKNL